MIRSTFTKIKRACVIALVPRIVRGDGRYTTKKIGKASINVLRKAGKSTDSGSKDGESECDKCRRFIEFVFGPSKPKTNTHIFKGENKTTIGNIEEMQKENLVHTRTKSDIDSDRQNNLLKDFFGADEDVLRKDNFNKNINPQTTTIDKHKLSQNRDNLDDDKLNTRQGINLSQAERDRDYDHSESQWSSETGRNFEKDSPTEDNERKRSNPRDTEIPDYIPAMNYKLQATTTKENEDKLSQKIENIEEISHTEASSPKTEGFKVAQNVLTDRYVNFSNIRNAKSSSDINESIDEIAQKCLDTPVNQIDNKLIKEIEKFGIVHTDEHKSKLNEDFVRMGSITKAEKTLHEVEIDLDKKEDKKEPIHCAEENKLGPSFEMPPHLDQGVAGTGQQTDSTAYNKMQMNQESEIFEENTHGNTSIISDPANLNESINFYDSRPQYDLNQPIIDPYDKKTLAFDNNELNDAVMESKLLDDQRIGKPSENEKDQAFAEAYVASSEAIPKEEAYKEPDVVEDRSHLDYIQSVYDCAPKEINWRPYPSFEAREEVMDFYTRKNEGLEFFELNHTETFHQESSESEPAVEASYEPQPEHIYTSTSVSSESREQISHSFVQPEEMINPLMEKNIVEPKETVEQPHNVEANLADTIETLPSLNPDGNVSLTELLRRVRMRNRMEYCREFAVHTLNVHAPETLPAESKYGKKTPPCPPPPPKCPPPTPCPPPPPACPPPKPPCVRPCKPPSKRPCPPPKTNPCKKFSGSSLREVLTHLTQNNPQVKIPQKYLLPILAYNAIRSPVPSESEEDKLLHENLVFRLSVLGKILLFHCTEAVDANLPRNRSELSFARDFEPWTPIPSWPITKKEEKKRFVCPKEGCKILPPPKLNSPCKENPCLNFPKRSNFSLTDLFSFSLVESLVCHTM